MTLDEFVKRFGEITREVNCIEPSQRFAEIAHERRLHWRPDVNAILLLDKLAGIEPKPGRRGITKSDFLHVYLDVRPEDVCGAATDDDIRDLVCCWVGMDEGAFVTFDPSGW